MRLIKPGALFLSHFIPAYGRRSVRPLHMPSVGPELAVIHRSNAFRDASEARPGELEKFLPVTVTLLRYVPLRSDEESPLKRAGTGHRR